MASRHPSALIASLLISIALSLASGARGAEDPSREEAQRLDASRFYKEGKALYDRGDFDGALERFRRAHDVWPDPLVLFAVAQAQRKKGDCVAALETYERFIEVATPSAVRTEAEARVSELQRTCVPPETPPPQVAAPIPVPTVSPVDRQGSSSETTTTSDAALASPPGKSTAPRTSARVALALTVGGVLLGSGGGGVYLWNSSRIDRWRNEDSSLSSGAGSGTSAAQFTQRQQANDDLARSIHRYDQAGLGLVIGAGLTLATAAVVYLLGRE